MSDRTIGDLRQMQVLPLSAKIRMTERRILDWIDYFGTSGVYVSFSGGKDSTVLLDIVRRKMGYDEIPAVFVDIPTQYPELREFVKTFDNVEIIKPKLSFMQVCEKYGFPMISKEVSECVFGAKKYLTAITQNEMIEQNRTEQNRTEQNRTEQNGRLHTHTSMLNLTELANTLNDKMQNRTGGQNQRLAQLLGIYTNKKTIQANIPSEDKSKYSQEKWKFLLDAPFDVSNLCCRVMKKDPAHKYTRETGRHPITAQMTDESRLRTQKWLQNGCNGFDLKEPISNPMSFWTQRDVLQYIRENNLKICSVYGEVVEDREDENQISLSDLGLFDNKNPKLKTTGCNRTGCMLCGFGCHLEKSPNRFEMLKETHPKMYNLLDIVQNNGITMRQAIEWINDNSDVHINL